MKNTKFRFAITKKELLSIASSLISACQLIIFGYILGIFEFGRLCHATDGIWENPCRLMGGPTWQLFQVGIAFFGLLILRILIKKWEKSLK